jgi:hypothetical protein
VAPRISLALAIHNHQPVGNFGWVFAEVYDRAYLPLLEALERHPGVRLSLHYTGPLLEWLAAERPEFLARLGALVASGQVELLGGGLYEPILASLPEQDRIDQLTRMAALLEGLTGRRPQGAWLAERVWEPDLPTALAKAGYRWTILDDQHFRAAAIPEANLWGAYTTEDQGNLLTVFGTEQGLRYRIPFGSVEDVIGYLRDHATEAGRRVGMMGDDGEKFGAWPTTYEHCWGGGRWIERFFEALEANAAWLTTVTPSQWLEHEPPIGRVYVPTSSYAEMGEWALPPDETVVFTKLLHDAVAGHEPQARWLRGGFWRNFQVRYREINDLHKQMLRASEKVEAMPAVAGVGEAGAADGPRGKARATDHLYQGQSNDCYWHGLFGGIYIVHMRMATLSHLIAAEDLADAAAAAARAAGGVGGGAGTSPYGARLADTDLDAIDEILVTSPGQTLVVDPAEGAGISSWDLRASRVALASVLRRRPEAYHQRLVAQDQAAAEQAVGDVIAPDSGTVALDEAPKTIHDVFATKEPGLAGFIRYDRHERRSGLVHLLPADGSTEVRAFVDATYEELGDFVEGSFQPITIADDQLVLRRLGDFGLGGTDRPLVLTKTYRFDGDRMSPTLALEVEAENPGESAVSFELAIEWNLNLLGGGHNPAAYYETETGERSPHDIAGEVASAAHLTFGNDHDGVRIEAAIEPAARLTWYPVETVSNSEGGFERVYQGSSLLFRWPIALAPGEARTFTVSFAVTQTVDHSAAEVQ